MTRKDYERLAHHLKHACTNAQAYYGWGSAVSAVADALQADNPRFDRDRFLRACNFAQTPGIDLARRKGGVS